VAQQKCYLTLLGRQFSHKAIAGLHIGGRHLQQ